MSYYYRRSSNPMVRFLTESIVNKIIAVNLVVFLLEIAFSRSSFITLFGLVPYLVIKKGFVWQLITYMFLHGGAWHLILNMFIIYMFGSPLESLWGSRRFALYYLVCGLGGAALSFVFSYHTAVIGASGAGYGILLAYGMLFPYSQVYIWGVIPMQARTLVVLAAIIEFLSGIGGRDGIAHFAHLGGMAAGLIYLRITQKSRMGYR